MSFKFVNIEDKEKTMNPLNYCASPVVMLLSALVACLGAVSVEAQTSTSLVAFQGRVTLSTGEAPADGAYDLSFEIYDVESAGVPLWSETQAAVQVTSGNFAVALGSSAAFPSGLFSGSPNLYLQIAVDTAGDGIDVNDVQTPRTPINAVPVALHAGNAAMLGGSPATDYSKQSDLNNALIGKADVSEVYSKVEVDEQQALQDSAIAATESELVNKADISTLFKWQVVTSGPLEMNVNRGYLVNATSEVTISLPAPDQAPQLGDVLRVSAVGPGGWRISQYDEQTINTGGLQIENPSTNWIPRDASRLWYDVASSGDGSRLIAAEANGGLLYTSTDFGQTWTPRESSRDWRAVASSADGSLLLAAAYGDKLYTSTDGGVNWTPRESDRSWVSAASSADGTHLVAVAEGDRIYTSTDAGETWSPKESTRAWRCVASSSNGSIVVAAGDNQLFVSYDGATTWTPRDTFRFWRTVASSADGSRLFAAENGGQIYVSVDGGVTWTARQSARAWRDIACSADGKRVIAAVFGGSSLYYSVDSGQTWKEQDSARDWFSVASSADGNRLVAAVYPGNIFTYSVILQQSTAGTTGGLSGGPGTAIELQYIGNNTFQPLSYVGNLNVF